MTDFTRMTRRGLLGGLTAAGTICLPALSAADTTGLSSVPAIGMGTWITFDVRNDVAARDSRVDVLRSFFEAGGRMVDSSPMYGSAEDVLGYCLARIDTPPVYAASKVWIPSVDLGDEQMEASRELWGLPRLDLMQVHNLLSYEGHIETLRAMKSAGQVRAIGITTSHGRRHEEMERIITADDTLDTVQLTYNIADREAESRLLPLARERGRAVIVNRPFQRGALIRQFEGKPLPDFAAEIGVKTWPQYLLKWVISHPAVTVAIPATSSVAHMRENMAVMNGPMPDAAMRARMADWVSSV